MPLFEPPPQYQNPDDEDSDDDSKDPDYKDTGTFVRTYSKYGMTGNQVFFFKYSNWYHFTNKVYRIDHSSVGDYRYFDPKGILPCTYTCLLLRSVL
jgi:hypothetical protein